MTIDTQFLFWVIAAVMLAAAIGFIAVPLLKGNGVFGVSQVAAAVLVPAVAIGLYTKIGSPQAMSGNIRPAQSLPPGAVQNRRKESAASVGNLVDGLRERLQQQPDDAGGWLLLARSYEHLGRYQDAVVAYQKAKDFGKTDVQLAERLQISRSDDFEGGESGTDPAIHGRLTLSADAMSLVVPDDTIFIFAKESRGDRMPIVALRKSVSDLPIEFALTDKQAMVPGTRLADYESLVVTARVSRSGLATDAVEGLEVWSGPVSPGHDDVELLVSIDRLTKGVNDE